MLALICELIFELLEPITEIFGGDIWRFIANLLAGKKLP
jgi:hypothetical protein